MRWKTLGRVGELALEKARRQAKDDIGIVARGGDPLSEDDTARDAVTVATVAERFLEEHVEATRKPATSACTAWPSTATSRRASARCRSPT